MDTSVRGHGCVCSQQILTVPSRNLLCSARCCHHFQTATEIMGHKHKHNELCQVLDWTLRLTRTAKSRFHLTHNHKRLSQVEQTPRQLSSGFVCRA